MLPLLKKKISAANLHTFCSCFRLNKSRENVALYDLALVGNVFLKKIIYVRIFQMNLKDNLMYFCRFFVNFIYSVV